jgi:hypothetical protein
MNTLGNRISEFVAAHKRFPTAVDFRRAETKLWEELTPTETWELLSEVFNRDQKFLIGFRYWLHWLQTVRFRVTEKVFIQLLESIAGSSLKLLTGKLCISRLKYGRKMLTPNMALVLHKLYLLSAAERTELKRKVLNSGTTTK